MIQFLTSTSIRRAALATTGLSALVASPVAAQTMDFPQRFVSPDDNGVDVVTGNPVLSRTEGAIGSGSDALVMQRVWSGTGWQDNLAGKLNRTTVSGVRKVTLAMGTQALTFTRTNGVFTPDNGDGSALVEAADGKSYTFTTADGTVYVYGNPNPSYTQDPDDNLRVCSSAADTSCILMPQTRTAASGAQLIYQWSIGEACSYNWKFDRETCKQYVRLWKVTDNAGQEMVLTYGTGAAGTAGWYRKTKVEFKRSVDPVPATTVNYTYPDSQTTNVTDPDGGTWIYKLDSSNRLKSIQSPTDSTPGLVYTYNTAGKVSQVTKAGIARTYSWTTSGSNTVVTTGGDMVSTIVSNPTIGRTVQTTDAEGNSVTNEYDYKQRLIRSTYPEGNKVQHGYDDRGNEVETRIIAKPGSNLPDIVTSAGYPAICSNVKTCNKPMWTQDAAGNRTDFTYDPIHGEVIREEKPAPTAGAPRPTIITEYAQFTATGSSVPKYLATKVRRCSVAAECAGSANETVITTSYAQPTLQPASVTVAAGDGSITATTSYTYTASGKVSTVDGPLLGSADTVYLFYTSGNRPLGVVGPDPDGAGPLPRRMQRTRYDTAHRVQGQAVGTTNTTSSFTGFTIAQELWTTYDAVGRKSREALYDGEYASTKTPLSVTQYSYDSKGRLDCTAVRMNPAVFGSLPASACTASTQGAAGPDRITKLTYDSNGKPVASTSGYLTTAAATEELAYTANGRVAWVEDAKDNRTAYSYDGYDRPIKAQYPVTTVGAQTASTGDYEDYGYDVRGLLTSVRDRAGGSHGMTYDALGRMTSKTSPNSEPTRTMTYDLADRLTAVQLAGDATPHSFTYDALGRALSAANAIGTVGYQYDLAGQRTRMTWPDGLYVSYDYDAAGNMTAIRENGATSGVGVLATFGYDDLGRRASLTYGNGVMQTSGFDGASRLSQFKAFLGTPNEVTTDLAYNSASQIISTTRAGASGYDWTSWSPTDRPYTANGLNQYLTAGAVTFGYDARGNLTSSASSGGTDTFTYSSENMLTSASGGVSLSYDPLGRLRQILSPTSATKFLYDGFDLIAEYDGTGVMTRRYVHGPNVDEPLVWYEGGTTSDRRFLLADERGSIVAVTNSSGGLISTNRYDEYGIPQVTYDVSGKAINANLGRFQYTGQTWLDELGIYYYKARMYSPFLGRFMHTDPIGYADGMNWYDYVGGDPVNRIDPSGTIWSETFRRGNSTCATWIDDTTGKSALTLCYEMPSNDILVIGSPRYVDPTARLRFERRGRGQGDMPQNNQTHTCPKGGRITLGLGGSASGAFLYLALGVGAEAGISIPTDFFQTGSLRGTQFYGSASFQALGGFGFFAGAGGTPSAGYSSTPLSSGVTGTHVVGGGAAFGVGGEGSVATNGSGASISGGPRAGVGAYAGYGGKVTATAATPQLGCTP